MPIRWPTVTVGQPRPAEVIGAGQRQRLGLGRGVVGGVDLEGIVQRIRLAAAPVPQRRDGHESDQHQQRNAG